MWSEIGNIMAKKKTTKRLAKRELEKYRRLLLEKWTEIVGDVTTMEENIFQGGGELSSMPVHMADIGTDSFEQEFGLELVAEEKKMLDEIQQALKRIETGEFGICEGLGIPIEKRRLEAIPWTRYSLEYAQMLEGNDGRFKNRSRPLDRDRPVVEPDEDDEDEEEKPAGDVEPGQEGMQSLDALEEEEQDDDEDREIA